MKYCPNCKKDFNGKEKYCDECGTKLEEYIEEVVVEETTTVTQEKKKVTPRWLVIVFSSISLVLFSFFLFAYLGDSVSRAGGTTINVGCYFGGGVSELINLRNSMPYGEYFAYSIILYVVRVFAYFGGFISTIVFSVFGIIGAVKAMNKDGEVQTKYLNILTLCALPHIYFSLAPEALSLSAGGSYSYSSSGWGVSLLITAIILTQLLFIAFRIVDSAIKKEKVLKNIFTSICILFITILLVSSQREVTFFTNLTNSSYSGNIGPFYVMQQSLYRFSAGSTNFIGLAFFYGLASAVFSIGALALFISAFRSIYKEKMVPTLISMICGSVAILTSSLLSNGAIGEYVGSNSMVISLSSSVIAAILLTIIVTVFLIVIMNLKSEKEVKQ